MEKIKCPICGADIKTVNGLFFVCENGCTDDSTLDMIMQKSKVEK